MNDKATFSGESDSSEDEITEAECNDDSWLVPDNVIVRGDISLDSGSVEPTKPRRRQIITDSDEENQSSSDSSSPSSPEDNSGSNKGGPQKSFTTKDKKDPGPSSIVKSVAAKKPKTFLQSLSEAAESKK
jgi:hypothetical protein